MTHKITRIIAFLTALFLARLLPVPAIGAADSVVLPVLNRTDGKQFLQDLCSAVAAWNDYSTRINMQTFKPNKVVKSDCTFYYKKHNQVRIEVIGGGYRNGTVLVKKDGIVKGHGGAFLGGMKLDLDPDSRMLILPNGLNCTRCDYIELLADLKDRVARGCRCAITTAPARLDCVPATVNLLEVSDPQNAGGNLYARVYVSADEKIPLRWEMYSGNNLFSIAEFKNPAVNTGLNDDLFRL